MVVSRVYTNAGWRDSPVVPWMSGVPTGWAKSPSNPLISKSDIPQIDAEEDEVGYATVVYASGRLGSPLDTLYLWCAPHGGSSGDGGIFLLTAPAPEGPWTLRNSGNPVVDIGDIAGSPDHVSSPYTVWDPVAEQLVMWFHAGGFTGNKQRTFVATSTDGVSWVVGNSGSPVLSEGATNATDSKYATYLKAFHDGSQLVGFYQGASTATPEGKRVCRATSTDGVSWTKTHRPAFAPREGTTENASGTPLALASGVAVFYTQQDDPRTLWRTDQPSGFVGWSSPRVDLLVALGADTSWDDSRLVGNDFVHDGSKFWFFYHGVDHTGDDNESKIGVASVTSPLLGFDTSWGKGPVV